jgi:hypothetical protein
MIFDDFLISQFEIETSEIKAINHFLKFFCQNELIRNYINKKWKHRKDLLLDLWFASAIKIIRRASDE